MGRATSKGNEAKSKMKQLTFRYAHAEIRTRVVVICGPTPYRKTTEVPYGNLEYEANKEARISVSSTTTTRSIY